MLKMKLKYFGHLMRRKDSLEKSPMLGTIDGKRRRGRQRMRWLDGVAEAVGVEVNLEFELEMRNIVLNPTSCFFHLAQSPQELMQYNIFIPPATSFEHSCEGQLDENDNPPTFSKPSYVITIMEDIMAGATVLFLNATDLDRSREYGQESIIYSLEGSSHFRINARSGEITTTSLLDREAKSEYILIVRAVDGGVGHNQKTGIATVNITLLDINDNYPVWKDEPYFINLVEMTPPNSDVTTVWERILPENVDSLCQSELPVVDEKAQWSSSVARDKPWWACPMEEKPFRGGEFSGGKNSFQENG
ncbi:Cadherin-23 [Varanus komodoensis]|nr:Cadherin-23 [Varanus komodoensis]